MLLYSSATTPKMRRKEVVLGLCWVKTTSLSGHHSRFGTTESDGFHTTVQKTGANPCPWFAPAATCSTTNGRTYHSFASKSWATETTSATAIRARAVTSAPLTLNIPAPGNMNRKIRPKSGASCRDSVLHIPRGRYRRSTSPPGLDRSQTQPCAPL